MACLTSLLVFLWLAVEVHGRQTQSFDQHWRDAVHARSSLAGTEFMRDATQLGAIITLSTLSVAAIFGFMFLKLRRAAVLMASNMIGAGFFNDVLKTVFQRARPEPFFGIPPPGDYSFPSGHSLCSFCFYGMIAALFVVRIQNRAARVAVVAAAALSIFSIGLSRIYLGVHYPTDVLAGWAIALSWISFLLTFDTKREAEVDE